MYIKYFPKEVLIYGLDHMRSIFNRFLLTFLRFKILPKCIACSLIQFSNVFSSFSSWGLKIRFYPHCLNHSSFQFPNSWLHYLSESESICPFFREALLDQPTKLQTPSAITFPHVILLHSMVLNVYLYLFYWLAAYVYFLC